MKASIVALAALFATAFAAPNAFPVPGCIKDRGTDQDASNGCCLKLKRDADAATSKANELAHLYERAMAVRADHATGSINDIEAREAFPIPGCIKERGFDQDASNGCCLKVKREAKAAADAAAEAFKQYNEVMKYRLV